MRPVLRTVSGSILHLRWIKNGVENPGDAKYVTPRTVAVEDPNMDGVMIGTQAPTPGHFTEMYLADLKFYHRKLNAFQAYSLYLQGSR